MADYLGTLLRYIGVAIAIGVIMFAVYRIQLLFGVKREAATGRALVTPWVIGFLIFTVFTIGSSLYLSFTEYNASVGGLAKLPGFVECQCRTARVT
jgi:multiple sugar transport system permease protein